jgi:hypothetical protein
MGKILMMPPGMTEFQLRNQPRCVGANPKSSNHVRFRTIDDIGACRDAKDHAAD